MQRQSLGSPASKQHHCAAASTCSPNAEEGDDDRQRRRWSSGSSRSLRGGGGSGGPFQADEQGVVAPEDEAKPGRPVRSGDHRSSVHLIPLLVFLCFLVLYLSSHDPAPKGAAGFGDLDGGLDAKAGAERRHVVAAKMRSQRRLKEVEKLRNGGGRGRKVRGGERLLRL